MEVSSVLLCKNKGMFIARKLYMDSNKEVYIANFYESFDPFHFEWPQPTCFFTKAIHSVMGAPIANLHLVFEKHCQPITQ